MDHNLPLTMMGVSHQTAPLEVRERLSFPGDEHLRQLKALAQAEVAPVVLLATCNRTELYCRPEHGPTCETLFRGLLGESSRLLEKKSSTAAVSHLYRVASGLNSMVLGENEILGQVRRAFERSRGLGLVDKTFETLFTGAISTARRARAHYHFGRGVSSVSATAVKVASGELGRLCGRRVLVVGAGEASYATVAALKKRGVHGMVITNRNAVKAKSLADRCGADAIGFEELDQALLECDLVLSSTSAPHFIIDRERLLRVMDQRKGRKLVLVDLAVPRDIDPTCGLLSGVRLVNLDDLSQQLAANLERRRRESVGVERHIEEGVNKLILKLARRRAAPLIRELRECFRREVQREVARLTHIDPAEQDRLERFAHRLVQKFLHGPTAATSALVEEGASPSEVRGLLERVGML